MVVEGGLDACTRAVAHWMRGGYRRSPDVGRDGAPHHPPLLALRRRSSRGHSPQRPFKDLLLHSALG